MLLKKMLIRALLAIGFCVAALFALKNGNLTFGLALTACSAAALLALIRIRMNARKVLCVRRKFRVVEYTYLTALNQRPTGFIISSDEGCLKGESFHVAANYECMKDVPELGQEIELLIPTDAEIRKANNGRYYFTRVAGYQAA